MKQVIFSKRYVLSIVALVALIFLVQLWWPVSARRLHEGDIVFRGTGMGVATLTLSKWTHCGILIKENGQWMVYEAIGPVKKTPLRQWKRHEAPYFYRVMRLKQPLTDGQLRKVKSYLQCMKGRRYDHAYRWSDDRQYCSELVWKAYHAAGIDLSQPRQAKTFLVFKVLPQKRLQRLISKKGLSLSEPMVPPSDLVHSQQLRRVW